MISITKGSSDNSNIINFHNENCEFTVGMAALI